MSKRALRTNWLSEWGRAEGAYRGDANRAYPWGVPGQNLNAELEIRHLQDKRDSLSSDHLQGLLEIQEIQMELTEELDRTTVVPRMGR